MKKLKDKRQLLIAIGNVGRRDDGLGWAFADALTDFEGDIEYRYQLQVEDAELIRFYDCVWFVDADRGEEAAPFSLQACKPAADFAFSTHALAPEAVLYLCAELYDAEPEAWLLGIKGSEWALQCGLSKPAQANLEAALAHFQPVSAAPV